MRERALIRVLFVAVGLFLAVETSASAERERPSVLTAAAAPEGKTRTPKSAIRERFVRLDRSQLGDEIRLELFPGVAVDARHQRTETPGSGKSIWIGKVIDGEGRVFLSTVDGVTVGQVRAAGKVYEIRYAGNGVNAISEIDTSALPNEGCDTGPAGPEQIAPGGRTAPAATSAKGRAVESDPCGVIDTMVLYTPAAKDEAGGASAIEAAIHLAISVTNVTFEDSGVTTRLSPVHIDEIDYVEAATKDPDGDAFDDRDALRNTSDGLMDEAHTLRDRYCADAVHLITAIGGNGDNDWCGAAYVMDPAPDPTHEAKGFAVTVLSCASSNFTFAHEMGHLFGARHDWYVDSAATPYTYAHGYVNRPERWRTIMAYNTECDDLGLDCDRQGLWSNPNIFFEGDPAGIPEGTSTSCVANDPNHPACDAEDWRVLNATDCTVANFRDRSVCTASAARNVWMKDTWFDTGVEPDSWQAGLDMWKSPYIWVRHNLDTTGAGQHIHQNPEQGQTNYVYVKLHNDFNQGATGQLKLYYAEASSGLTWPGDWTLFADNAVAIGAHATLLQPSTWSPPGTGHYCLLARWSTPNNPSDPLATPEGNSVSSNARNNNNIVWRNVNVVNLEPNVPYAVPNLKVKSTQAGASLLDLAVELPDNDHNFLRAGGRILLDLDGLHDNWVATGAHGTGVRPTTHPLYGNVVEILDTTSGVATLDDILLATGEVEPVRFILTAPYVPPPPPIPPVNDEPPGSPAGAGTWNDTVPDLPPNHFPLDLVQIEGTQRVGGVGYEIVVATQGGSGAVPDGHTVPGTPLLLDFDAGGALVLDWASSCNPASDVDYAVYAGTLGDFRSHSPITCSTGGATSLTMAAIPTGNLYFLVVPTDLRTDGSFGKDRRGVERPAGAAACRPHAVASCN